MLVIYGNCELKGFMSKCGLKSTTKSPLWWGFFLMISFFLLSLFSFSPLNVFLQVAVGAVSKPTSSVPPLPQPLLGTLLHGGSARAPDAGCAPEPICSPRPDERQLRTAFSLFCLFCLKTYHGLPCERECKEKSQIKPELRSPLRRTPFVTRVLQVHFTGTVNWSEIRARFQKAAPKMCPLSTHACELSRRDRSLSTCEEAG